MTDAERLTRQPEGQFLERKSCVDRSGARRHRRNAAEVAADVAETLAAMANADGGTLALGIEDDGAVSGVDYPSDKLELIRRAPQALVVPPLNAQLQEVSLAGKRVLVFEVDWSVEVHRLTNGRYLFRVDDQNMPFPADGIEAMKEARRRRVTEQRPVLDATLGDVDLDLVAEFSRRSGSSMPPEELLQRYRLVEVRGATLVPTLAVLLLFGRDPGRWHPRCGIDFVKYEGTERKVGAALNVVKRERLEAPLVRLIEDAYGAIQPHVRERQQLVDLLFEERMEYPPFAWQEAIVNAVAHRDYGYQGNSIEVWLFDDRMEIRSPGQLVEPVTLERLRQRERVHASRNPRIVRVLTEYGYMREQGEGVPRMFYEMENAGLNPPELRLEADVIFTVILRNQVVYDADTLRWLRFPGFRGLSTDQKRLLAFARAHDYRFTSRDFQKLAQLDLYAASLGIRDLVRRGVARLAKKGGRVYVIALEVPVAEERPPEYVALEPVLTRKGFITNSDIRAILGVSVDRAGRIAKSLVATGWLLPEGERRGRRYVPAGRVY